jgi:uncharacterized protein
MPDMTTASFSCSRDGHLFGPGPKRILSLDGGGVRGIVALAFLERIEAVLAENAGRPVRLCDYFDLIGGTSTGAVIATGLALGFTASQIRSFYETMAYDVFRRPFYRVIGVQAKFDSARLRARLQTVLGDRTLDSTEVETGLAITTKRLDTGSSWVLLNNSRSDFWETPDNRSFQGNRYIRLVDLVRASAAAPHFFDPELIQIEPGAEPGLFVDGALTPHNNPALQFFLAVALPPFGLNWTLGPSNLTVVSIGAGSYRPRFTPKQSRRAGALGLAVASLAAQIADGQQLVLALMSWFGESRTAWVANSEVGDLGRVTPPFGNLFRFQRYDILLEAKWLAEHGAEALGPRDIAKLRRMDDPTNLPTLFALAERAAHEQVRPADWEA